MFSGSQPDGDSRRAGYPKVTRGQFTFSEISETTQADKLGAFLYKLCKNN